MQSLSPGARQMLASAFYFSLMSLFVKLAGQRLPSQEIVVVRAALSLILAWIGMRRAGLSPLGRKKGLLILRGLFGTAALSCFYYALTKLPLAEVTVLHYLNPPLAALFAWLALGEKPGRALLYSLLVSFAGMLCITRPAFLFGGSGQFSWPVASAIAGAFFSAAAYVTVRRLAVNESPHVIVFYFPLVALPLMIPTLGESAVWPNALEWIFLLGVGITTQLGQLTLTRGLALETTGRATAISYTQVPFAALWGVLCFADLPNGWTATGALLVMFGTWLATRPEVGQPRHGADALANESTGSTSP